MFEKLANAGKSLADTVKSADLGSIGKIVAGGALLIGSVILTVAATGSKDDNSEYYPVHESGDNEGQDESNQNEQTEESLEEAES